MAVVFQAFRRGHEKRMFKWLCNSVVALQDVCVASASTSASSVSYPPSTIEKTQAAVLEGGLRKLLVANRGEIAVGDDH